jgi:integrase/recombinase XerD
MGGELAVVETDKRQAVAGREASTDAQVLAMWAHGKAPHTCRAYAFEARRFLAFAGAPLGAVTLGDVQAYAEHLAARGLAPASQVRALAAVKSLLTFAHRIGYLPVNVGAAEKLPALKFKLAERIVSRRIVAEVIAGEDKPRDRALVSLLYFGGLRVAEACGLRWRDVQARDGGAAQVTVYGKGSKTRAVLLPAALATELETLRDGAGPDVPVFAGRAGALTTSQAWRIVKAAGKRAGVPGLSPHWLRHALASHALEDGADIALVRDTLGHASAATTSRYLHARPNDSAGLHLRPLPVVGPPAV